MKKIYFILISFLLFIPVVAQADGVENYYINATVEKNGDLLVEEYFNLTGSYNGSIKGIDYKSDNMYEFDANMPSFGGSLLHNGENVEILEVRTVDINPNFSFSNVGGDVFKQVISAKKGDYGVYTVSNTNNGKSLTIYNPSMNYKAFYLKYRIKNIAILHDDVAEIGWNILGNSSPESIGNLKAYIYFPNNKLDLRGWAHGPLHGNIEIVDRQTILVSIKNLSKNTPIDIRATFDKNVISESNKKTNTMALDKIILYENDKAAQANYERLNQEKLKEEAALYYLSEFEIKLTRDTYNTALKYINKIEDENKKQDYLNKLSEIKKELDIIEEKNAYEAIEKAKNTLNYDDYISAFSTIDILDNPDIKNKLLDELNLVSEQIQANEYKIEIKNIIIGLVILVLTIYLGYLIYKKFIKMPEVDFNQKYFRDIPNDYSPEIVSYLMRKKIISRALSASVLNLIRKNIIISEKLDKKNYKLTLVENYLDKVTVLEREIIELVFLDQKTIETKKMKKIAKRKYRINMNNWKSYHRIALFNSKEEKFYEYDDEQEKQKNNLENYFYIIFILIFIPVILIVVLIAIILFYIFRLIFSSSKLSNGKKRFVFVIILVLLLIINIYKMFTVLNMNYYTFSLNIYLINSIISIILIALANYNKKLTIKGALEFKKWKAFKSFLKHFGKFDTKEIKDISLWEEYLVYATLFGCSKKIIKTLKINVTNFDSEYIDNVTNLYFINKTIITSVKASHRNSRTALASAQASRSNGSGYSGRDGYSGGSFSSGSGSGGGFSSGGGSFGGGGSIGRF